MEYKGKTFDTMGQVFDEALRLAKSKDSTEIKNFFNTYAEACARDNHTSLDEGIIMAKRNLGYFAGYCNSDTIKLINETYNTSHPIFG